MISQKTLGQFCENLHIFNSVHVFDSLDSTNTKAAEMVNSGAQSGAVVVANEQLCGRGRMNRIWLSGADDVTLSIILRPPHIQNEFRLLPLVAGVVLVRALKILGIEAKLKWPNDIVIKNPHSDVSHKYFGHYLKVGGVLMENSFSKNQLAASIIGLGINVGGTSELKKNVPHAVALKELNSAISGQEVAQSILSSFDNFLVSSAASTFCQDVLREYKRICVTIGRKVWAKVPHNHQIVGTAKDIRKDGALLIDVNGKEQPIVAGDVNFCE